MSKREILVILVFFACTLWGLRNPLVAACLFTWNNIFRPLRWAKAGGIFGPASFPTHYIVAGVLGFSAILNWSRLRWNLGCTIILILILRDWAGVPFALHTDVAFESASTHTKFLVPLILIGCILTDFRSQVTYLYVLAVSVGFHLAWAGFHALVLKGSVEDAMGIPGGQMTGRNDFTVAATGCIPLMAFMAWYYRGRWQGMVRWSLRGMLGFGAIAFLYSGSRGALLGLAAMGAWWAVMTGRPGRRVSIALVLLICSLPLVPAFVWERMDTIEWSGEQSEGSAQSRIEAMKMGLDLTNKHPIMGVGPDNSWRVSADLGYRADRGGVETHMIWLKCSSEYGWTGLIFFLWVIGLTLVRLRARGRAARANGNRLAEEMSTALSCAIVGFLASGTFTSKYMSEYLWSFFVLSYAFLATPLESATPMPDSAPETVDRAGDPQGSATPRPAR